MVKGLYNDPPNDTKRDAWSRYNCAAVREGAGRPRTSPESSIQRREAFIKMIEAHRLRLRASAQQELQAPVAALSSHIEARQSEHEAQVQGMKRDLVKAWAALNTEHVQAQEARRAEKFAIKSSKQELTTPSTKQRSEG